MFLLTNTLTHGVNRLHAIRLSSSAYFQSKPHIMLRRLHLHCLCSDHFVWVIYVKNNEREFDPILRCLVKARSVRVRRFAKLRFCQ